MSGPPTDIPASQLWAKLSSPERPFKLVDFPRLGPDGNTVGQLAIRVLTQEEQMICSASAEDFCRKHLKDAKREEIGYNTLYSDAYSVELLYRACRDADDPNGRPAFPTAKSIRETLTTDECGILYSHYLTIMTELGPMVTEMSEAEMEAWIDRLAEGGSAFLYDTFSLEKQKLLLMHMAYQLRPSRTDSISAGELPVESSPSDNDSTPPGESAEE